MPLGSPTTTVPTSCSTSQDTTDLAASWWAWRTLRRWRASALRPDAQGDRAHRPHRVGDRPAEAHPQRGGAAGHAEPDTGTVEAEAPQPEANRDQAPLSAGEACPDSLLLAPGRLEACDGVVLQDRLGAVS